MSLNVIAVMGRLVADPELRKTPNDISTTTFTIACDRNFVKAGAERQTDFFDIVCWRQTAEFACKHFRKGQLVAANGSLQTRTYEDREGKTRKVYEIVADNLHFAEPKNNNEQGSQGQDAKDDVFTVIDDEDCPF